ncbi:10296_t:CDS:2, partial [Acaulospora morrowiae]
MTAKSSRFAELRNNFEQNGSVSKPIFPKPHALKKPPQIPPRENSVSSQFNSSVEANAHENNQSIKIKSRHSNVNESQDDENYSSLIDRNNINELRKISSTYSNGENKEEDNVKSRTSLVTKSNVRNAQKIANKFANYKDQEENEDNSKATSVTNKNIRNIHKISNKYSNEEEDPEEYNDGIKPSLITKKNVRNIHRMANQYSNEEEEQEGDDNGQRPLITKKNVRNINKIASGYLNAEEDQEDANGSKSSSLINRNNANGLRKIVDAYSDDEEDEHEHKVKPSSLITSKNVRNVHKISNSLSKVEGKEENDNRLESSLFTAKNVQKVANYSNSERERKDKSQLSSLMTKNKPKAASYSYEDEDNTYRNISNKPRSLLITQEKIKRVQDDDKPPLPSRKILNRTTQKETNHSHEDEYEDLRDRSNSEKFRNLNDHDGRKSNSHHQPLVSRPKFQDLQNIASSIVKLDKDGGKKPPPLPPRKNFTEEHITKSIDDKIKLPPLPPRGNSNRQDASNSSDVSREAKGPRPTRPTSYSSQRSIESPSIQKRNSGISIKSNESTSKRSAFDDDTLYEGIDDYPDPVSRCLPIVGEGFEGHLDCSEIDFSVVDDYARQTPESETVSIATLSDYLTSAWDHDLYKLRAIYAWITDNISYDCELFYSGNSKFKMAKDVLKTRTAVCAGYSELFYELSREADLDVCKIGGSAKGAGYNVGDPIGPGDYAHAWNGVFYEGEYLLVDCTWGAGVVSNKRFEKKFRSFYFMCSPTKLIYSHFPNNVKEQYLQPTITRPEFINQPHYKSTFFDKGLRLIRYIGCEIEIPDDNAILDIEQTIVDGSVNKIQGHLDWKGQSINAFTQILSNSGPNGGVIYRVRIGCPTRGEGILNLFYYNRDENYGSQITTMKIKNLGTGTKYKRFVELFAVPFPCSVIRPFTSSLEYNKKVRFEVILFNQDASEILIISPGFEKKAYLEHVIEKTSDFGGVTMSCDVMLNYK